MNFSEKDLKTLKRINNTSQIIQVWHEDRKTHRRRYEELTKYILRWHRNLEWELYDCHSDLQCSNGDRSVEFWLFNQAGWYMKISAMNSDLDIPSCFLNCVSNPEKIVGALKYFTFHKTRSLGSTMFQKGSA